MPPDAFHRVAGVCRVMDQQARPLSVEGSAVTERSPVPLQKGQTAARVACFSPGTDRTTTSRRGRTDFQPRPRHDLHFIPFLASMRPTIPGWESETHSSSG